MIRRWWPTLVAAPFLLGGLLYVVGPYVLVGIVAIGLAVAAGKPVGMPRRRR